MSAPRSSPPSTSSQKKWLPLALLALITLTALGLRLWQVRESLWLDELHSSWVVVDGLGPIPLRAGLGNYSPAYFYLPWAATKLWGHTELALRLPSLVAGVALVPLLFFFVVQVTGRPVAGLLAASMAALDPNGLFYSIEARPFALVELLGVGQVWLFWLLIQGRAGESESGASAARRKRSLLRGGFVIVSLLLFYLHYTTQLLLLGEVVAYAIISLVPAVRRWQPDGTNGDATAWPAYRPLQFMVDLALILAGQLAALPHLLWIFQRRANWEQFVRPQPPAGMLTLFPLVIYVLAPLACLGIGTAWWMWRRREREACVQAAASAPGEKWVLVMLVVCWFLVPVAASWAATQFDIAALFLRRYLMASAAAPIVLAGIIYAATPTRLARGLCWIWVLGLLLGGDSVVTTGVARQFVCDGRVVVHSDEDWRGAVAALNTYTAGREESVLLYAGLIEAEAYDPLLDTGDVAAYYTFPVRGIYRLEATCEPGLLPAYNRAPYSLPRIDPYQLNRIPIPEKPGSPPVAWILVRGQKLSWQILSNQESYGIVGPVAWEGWFSNLGLIRRSTVHPETGAAKQLQAAAQQ